MKFFLTSMKWSYDMIGFLNNFLQGDVRSFFIKHSISMYFRVLKDDLRSIRTFSENSYVSFAHCKLIEKQLYSCPCCSKSVLEVCFSVV